MINKFLLIASLVLAERLVYAQDIRDVKAPEQPPADFTWWIVLGLLVVSGIIYFVVQKYLEKTDSQITPSQATLSPWEIALRRLDNLLPDALINKGQFKELYSGLSDIIRSYIEARFSIRAPEMTTEEFLQSMKDTEALSKPQKEILKSFMESSDMVKFAKFTPESSEAVRAVELTRTFILETKQVVEPVGESNAV